MALFVDLDDDDVEPPQHFAGGKVLWSSGAAPVEQQGHVQPLAAGKTPATTANVEEAREAVVTEAPNWNSMTDALGCYP